MRGYITRIRDEFWTKRTMDTAIIKMAVLSPHFRVVRKGMAAIAAPIKNCRNTRPASTP